jgi:hypothetical protein
MVFRKASLIVALVLLLAGLVATASAFPAPSFCNKIETTSSMNLKTASLTTQMGNNFIGGGSHSGVDIFNNIQVNPYSEGIPSKGSISAFIKGSIREGGRGDILPAQVNESPQNLFQIFTFFDSTSLNGDITGFSKSMRYSSLFA